MGEHKKLSGKWLVLIGMGILSLLLFLAGKAVSGTSTDAFCASCHIHPQATETWKRSTHFDNQRGIHIHCVECHLPPKGEGYLVQKTRTGLRDVYGKLFKDPESLNWEEMSRVAHATGHTFENSCIACHQNNFPIGLSAKGREAHLYYEQHAEELHCINCHITVGHYDPERQHEQNLEFGQSGTTPSEIYSEPGTIKGFSDFTEYIPGSSVQFEMIAIPGGTFHLGSPEDEPFRKDDEGPVREVTVSPFFMARTEVTWDEYMAFFSITGAKGKTSGPQPGTPLDHVDAISGPTPPYGAPDQGWGTGTMPAITMTHHAAEVYCRWLSRVTGKHYRLPTEAEWEYAARGGTSTPYFFDADPRRYVRKGIRNRLFGTDTAGINTYVTYAENSGARYASTTARKENPFGLKNMLGNVAEFCSDRYAADTYSGYPAGIIRDPEGPGSGEEYVIRGGSFLDGAENVRCASREQTRTAPWQKTDPQIPKSIWWYTDCTHVGFRVVCDYTSPVVNE